MPTVPRRILPLRDRILGKFPPDTAKLLIEFSKNIADLEADYVIFMARKALRLYDLLLLAGAPPCKQPILSNHILDQNLQIFANKKIVLVDDTLILGTSLGKATRKLVEAGAASVTQHVFCVDVEHWCRELLTPTKVFCHFDHQRMLTFCASEVAALSSVALPYLSDFPISEGLKLSTVDLALLQNLKNWDAYTLTSPSQEKEGVTVLTFLPRAELLDEIDAKIGIGAEKLIDLTKVRAFIRKTGNAYWGRLVPIATIKPIKESDIDSLFDTFLSVIGLDDSKTKEKLHHFLLAPVGKIRFVQYVVSAIVGELLMVDIDVGIAEEEFSSQVTKSLAKPSAALELGLEWLSARPPSAFGRDQADIRRGPRLRPSRTQDKFQSSSLVRHYRFRPGKNLSYRNDPTVDGEQFWEHLSRIKKQLREFERADKISSFWIGGKLIRNLNLERVVEWKQPLEFKIITEIEEFKLTTKLKGGQIR